MKIRSTEIQECWCDNCNAGMITVIMQKAVDENTSAYHFLGKKFTCNECGHENILEDIIVVKPKMYFLVSAKDGIAKTNDDLAKYLRS